MTDFNLVKKLPETINTDRLILRAPDQRDIGDMARLANNTKIFQMLSRLPHPYKESDAVEFVTKLARSETEHAYSISTRDDNFIGVISLLLTSENSVPELGYWLGEPYWGEGYGTEAAAAIVEALDAAGCAVVNARVRTSNSASTRLLEKIGFKITGDRVEDCGPHKGISVTFLQRERIS